MRRRRAVRVFAFLDRVGVFALAGRSRCVAGQDAGDLRQELRRGAGRRAGVQPALDLLQPGDDGLGRGGPFGGVFRQKLHNEVRQLFGDGRPDFADGFRVAHGQRGQHGHGGRRLERRRRSTTRTARSPG